MAITYDQPLSKWYFDESSKSEWTLDYPPFFAYFEWVIAQVASYLKVDPDMLKVTNLNYRSHACVAYQRATVIASDLVFVYACWRFIKQQ